LNDAIDRLNAALSGRYTLLREIGEGGMATVYLADDVRHNRKVALKVLKPELAAVVGSERFLAEIETTANLQHPHILPLFDSGEADGFLFFVMPYIEGETLRERLEREGQLGVEEAVRIAREVADALDYAHRAGVIHRDIKPANILLHDGRPVVADFGIAVAVSAAGAGRLTETGMSLGTPHYMSPEQASAERDLTARSDVYSLGCVLYEMLAGQPPHTGSSAQRILVSILTEAPKPVEDLRHTVPSHVAGAVAKAIEKLPADRFESAKTFMDALGNATFAYAASARPAGVGAADPGRRSGGTAVAGLRTRTLSLLPWAVAVAALLLWATGRGTTSVEPRVTMRAELTVPGVETGGSTERVVKISPDGRTLATVYRSGLRNALAVRRSDEVEFRTIAELEDDDAIAFSPEGAWIAYGGYGLWRVPVTGGASVPIIDAGSSRSYYPFSWSDDGTILFSAVVSDEFGTWAVGANGGEPVRIAPNRASSGQFLSERHVLLGVPGEGARFYDLEADTSRLVVGDAIQVRFVPEVGRLLWADPSGTVWAATFDPSTGRLESDPAIVLTGVSLGGFLAAHFDVSSNGTLVYAVGGAAPSDPRDVIVSVALDGTVTPEPIQPRWIEPDPRWSRDGRFVAYHGGEEPGRFPFSQIYVYDMVAGGRPRALTSGGTNRDPVWSPHEDRVLWGSWSGGVVRELFSSSVNGGDPDRFVVPIPPASAPLEWLPDDRLLLSAGRGELWIVDLSEGGPGDTASARAYIQLEDVVTEARVAPPGDLAAYATRDDNYSPSGLYLRAFPEAGPPTIVSPRGFGPVFSPDGGTLYFREEGRDSLMAVSIDRGPPLRMEAPRGLARWPARVSATDMHPDGTRFAGVLALPDSSRASGEERRYFIVTDWFEELRARLGEEGS